MLTAVYASEELALNLGREKHELEIPWWEDSRRQLERDPEPLKTSRMFPCV